MRGQILKNRVLIAVVLLAVLTVSCPNAYAWGDHDRWGGHDRGRGHYYYRGGHWRGDNSWFWGGIAIGALTAGAVVATLPPRYEVVYVSGAPYYYCDDVYFRPCRSGYTVVSAPVVVAAPVVAVPVVPVQQAQAQYPETVVINVPNAHGTYTPVTLMRHGSGYIGPQGEYYEGNPTVEQLRALYGR